MSGAAEGAELIRIRPRPMTNHIGRGRSVVASTIDGLIAGDPGHGFFVHETRLISRWIYSIDGAAPVPNAFSNVTQSCWMGYYVTAAPGATPPPPDEGSGQVQPESQKTLELRISRHVDGGLHEDVDLTNYSGERSSFELAIAFDGDFADQAETRRRKQRGKRTVDWNPQSASLQVSYEASRGQARIARSLTLRSKHDPASADFVDGAIIFRIALDPLQRWHGCLFADARIESELLAAPRRCYGAIDDDDPSLDFVREATHFSAPGSGDMTTDVLATLSQARSDLGALRLFDLDHSRRAWTVAAGLPLYVALFGRDTLTTGWQAGLLGPEIMTGTLHTLAGLQGTRVDDSRDEQPGKMLHEAHTGPLSMLGYNSRLLSFSSVTTSGLYAFIAAELWHWTGDKELVRPFIEPALRALRWLDRYGDLDGDGFYEYARKSADGPIHQAWKDSPDAIVYDDGRLVEPPIATCEEQAFAYVARLHLAETVWWLGEHDLAKRLYREASELKKRFNDSFWMEDEGYFALALDADKRQVRSIASNAGHCLAAGIAEASLVPRVAARMFEEDLFSGWGIRTLSSLHPRYNPYSYHLGSIWPVEQGTFAIGLWRYGLHDEVHCLARAVFDAAALFEYHRLPELFGGHPRTPEHPFPGIYPNANSIQAWSSSAVFSLLQAMLGLYPYAPLRMLMIDPQLPPWLPEITLQDLRIGQARLTIRFRRGSNGRTSYDVQENEGNIRVVRQPSPWSLTAHPPERLRDLLASFQS